MQESAPVGAMNQIQYGDADLVATAGVDVAPLDPVPSPLRGTAPLTRETAAARDGGEIPFQPFDGYAASIARSGVACPGLLSRVVWRLVSLRLGEDAAEATLGDVLACHTAPRPLRPLLEPAALIARAFVICFRCLSSVT